MTTAKPFDDAVVGAGILGLAHAYELARRGRRVVVFERHPRAKGASVRNFGMLWPIGQPFGPLRHLAARSLEIWLQVLASSGVWHERTGSLHLAYHDDEAEVLREFAAQSREHGESALIQTPAQVRQKTAAVKQDGLRVGLWSAAETCVDPREVVANLPDWLSREFGVDFHFGTAITGVAMPALTAGNATWLADRLWVCSGDELNLLYAEQLERCGLVKCKLQMMRSQAQPAGARIGPMLAAGLTLRHYGSFRNCPSLPAVCRRVSLESPWFDSLGIHVLVSQNGHGELTIGDSHEYGEAIEPFDKAEIDDLIIAYLQTFLAIPDVRIASRWHGTYAKHPTEPYVTIHPAPAVTATTAVGGAGMTFSFGLAEQIVARELGDLAPDRFDEKGGVL